MNHNIASNVSAGFDDRNIHWRKLGDFEHFVYTVFDVDEAGELVDFGVKLDPEARIFLHRHRALTHTFVIQGEHRLYEPDGALKEVRPVGSYTASPATPDPHREGGGKDGCVVFYSTRGSAEGVVFEVLDDGGQVVATLSIEDFVALFELQGNRPGT